MKCRAIIFAFGLLLSNCDSKNAVPTDKEPTDKKDNSDKKIILVGVANQSFYDALEPMVDLLNKRLDKAQLRLVASISWEEHLERVADGSFDLVFTNGLIALDTEKKGYSIVAKYGDDSTYCSALVTRKGFKIAKVSDLNGKNIAISGKHSILGDMAPLVHLKQKGVQIETMKKAYFPSFESSLLNVYLGKCDIAGVWCAVLKNYIQTHPEIGKAIEVKWKTESLPNLAIIMKKELDNDLKKNLLNELLNLHKTPEGLSALSRMGLSHIARANSATYQKLRMLNDDYNAIKFNSTTSSK